MGSSSIVRANKHGMNDGLSFTISNTKYPHFPIVPVKGYYFAFEIWYSIARVCLREPRSLSICSTMWCSIANATNKIDSFAPTRKYQQTRKENISLYDQAENRFFLKSKKSEANRFQHVVARTRVRVVSGSNCAISLYVKFWRVYEWDIFSRHTQIMWFLLCHVYCRKAHHPYLEYKNADSQVVQLFRKVASRSTTPIAGLTSSPTRPRKSSSKRTPVCMGVYHAKRAERFGATRSCIGMLLFEFIGVAVGL